MLNREKLFATDVSDTNKKNQKKSFDILTLSLLFDFFLKKCNILYRYL